MLLERHLGAAHGVRVVQRHAAARQPIPLPHRHAGVLRRLVSSRHLYIFHLQAVARHPRSLTQELAHRYRCEKYPRHS